MTGEGDLPALVDPSAEAGGGRLWPSSDYSRQVERLRAAVGKTVYLAEIDASEVQLGVRITGKPYVLLGVVDFPRPEPVRGIAPHLILLDDGRGVNLGRILRLSVGHAFGPAPEEILFRDRLASQTLLFGERRLTGVAGTIPSRALAPEMDAAGYHAWYQTPRGRPLEVAGSDAPSFACWWTCWTPRPGHRCSTWVAAAAGSPPGSPPGDWR